jgi:hypothetical protein
VTKGGPTVFKGMQRKDKGYCDRMLGAVFTAERYQPESYVAMRKNEANLQSGSQGNLTGSGNATTNGTANPTGVSASDGLPIILHWYDRVAIDGDPFSPADYDEFWQSPGNSSEAAAAPMAAAAAAAFQANVLKGLEACDLANCGFLLPHARSKKLKPFLWGKRKQPIPGTGVSQIKTGEYREEHGDEWIVRFGIRFN